MRLNPREKTTRAPMPDWLRNALAGKKGYKIVPLNKAAGARRNLSIDEIAKLIS